MQNYRMPCMLASQEFLRAGGLERGVKPTKPSLPQPQAGNGSCCSTLPICAAYEVFSLCKFAYTMQRQRIFFPFIGIMISGMIRGITLTCPLATQRDLVPWRSGRRSDGSGNGSVGLALPSTTLMPLLALQRVEASGHATMA